MSTQDQRIRARMDLHQHFTADGVAHGTPKQRAEEVALDMIRGMSHAKVLKALEIAEIKAKSIVDSKRPIYSVYVNNGRDGGEDFANAHDLGKYVTSLAVGIAGGEGNSFTVKVIALNTEKQSYGSRELR